MTDPIAPLRRFVTAMTALVSKTADERTLLAEGRRELARLLATDDWLPDAFALPRAPRLPREDVRRSVPPMQWSFMAESRRLDNTRMKRELRLRLRYPDVATGIAAAQQHSGTPCSG